MRHKTIGKETAARYTWGDACDGWILADTPSLSVKEDAMPPGRKERLHVHSVAQQFFFVLKGTAGFYADDEKHILTEGHGLLLPPKVKHFIANEGSETLAFLVISQPPTEGDRTNLDAINSCNSF